MATLIRDMVDFAASRAGMTKKSGTWYLSTAETILVLNLQKSNFATRYFLNVAVWLRAVAPAEFPAEQSCHIRTRLGRLAPDADRADHLLDAEWVAAHTGALDDLDRLLETTIGWVIDAVGSVDALRRAPGKCFLARSLVTGAAQDVIAGKG